MTANTARKRFTDLLNTGKTLVLPGAHDAVSARLVEAAGFGATYIGSYATSAAAYGLPDVGALTMTELAEHAGRVAQAVSIPVLADAEAGFYDAPGIWRTVESFERSGICGIHIEDHAGGKHTPEGRSLLPLETVVQRVRAAVEARTDPDFKIIARTDAMWVLDDVDEALRRMEAFAAVGADLVFPTAITPDALASVRDRIPCKVLVLGDLPPSSIAQMTEAGADVVLFYGFTLTAAASGISKALTALTETGDIRRMDHLLEDNQEFEARLGYDQYVKRASRYRT
ncbi:isocitrate lyase/PEP mutase family protein (plasmid) [Arthrobacter agilis]|uniref:isocitrate lyase/PEP mutase family protein n=1 Tax=Arthrobacter agilis TaxID=37921 RepID=UPI002366BD8A|nr:isocitrate lyase/PEP mutase family protein [Arthrobacter agilis]WDF35295.1 isocitrate lyase/PEP mutase family protein [Arthrobacter agilis]